LNDATAGVQAGGASDAPEKKAVKVDIPLMLYFLFWYVGNYYVSKNEMNRMLFESDVTNHLTAMATYMYTATICNV
jgi:hypothetical protein